MVALPTAADVAKAHGFEALDTGALESIVDAVVTAVAEKIAALETASFFAERRQRADRAAFRKLMHRKGGEPPRPGDEIPPTLRKTRKAG